MENQHRNNNSKKLSLITSFPIISESVNCRFKLFFPLSYAFYFTLSTIEKESVSNVCKWTRIIRYAKKRLIWCKHQKTAGLMQQPPKWASLLSTWSLFIVFVVVNSHYNQTNWMMMMMMFDRHNRRVHMIWVMQSSSVNRWIEINWSAFHQNHWKNLRISAVIIHELLHRQSFYLCIRQNKGLLCHRYGKTVLIALVLFFVSFFPKSKHT